jgi:purine operon repressor
MATVGGVDMEKLRRSERIIAMTKTLLERPYKLFSLNFFTDLFSVAKSTVSEDITIIRQSLQKFDMGFIETYPGAAGGVKYLPFKKAEEISSFVRNLCDRLAKPDRILPGGFIYMTDIVLSPSFAKEVGEIFATKFSDLEIDYVITVETKGIPLALMTAHAYNVPLVIIRRDAKVTEGSSVSINYVSGSSRRMQSMTLAKRALPVGARVLIIDDFMKAGGTTQGMIDLMSEFDAHVAGIGVLVETAEPAEKLVKDYISLAILENIDERTREIKISPSTWVL